MANKKGLGRGLEALFSIYDEENDVKQTIQDTKKEEKDGVNLIAISDIIANPNQPRKIFDEEALQELAASIKQYGVVQPIVVVKNTDGKYMIIAGERRYRASKLAGLAEMPCVIRDYTERQIKEIALIENLQREDLNPVESARALKQLLEEYNLTQENVADRIGKSRPYVTNLIRMLQLTPDVLKLIETNKLSLGHAKSLLPVTDARLQIKLALYSVENNLSVRDLEKLIKRQLSPRKQVETSPLGQSRELAVFTEEMQRIFATKVTILGNDNRGKICIDYFSKDDLDRLHSMITILNKKTLTLQDLKNFNIKH